MTNAATAAILSQRSNHRQGADVSAQNRRSGRRGPHHEHAHQHLGSRRARANVARAIFSWVAASPRGPAPAHPLPPARPGRPARHGAAAVADPRRSLPDVARPQPAAALTAAVARSPSSSAPSNGLPGSLCRRPRPAGRGGAQRPRGHRRRPIRRAGPRGWPDRLAGRHLRRRVGGRGLSLVDAAELHWPPLSGPYDDRRSPASSAGCSGQRSSSWILSPPRHRRRAFSARSTWVCSWGRSRSRHWRWRV